MSKRTIDDVEYVADAIILGHLRAAAVNIDYAVKDFKRHHYELKDSELAKELNFLRSWTNQQLCNFVQYCNKKVQGVRESKVRNEMNRRRRSS